MARFNTQGHKARPAVAFATSPITTVSQRADTHTFQGGAGWTRTAQGELFLLSTGAFLDGKGSFYESGEQQDARLRGLVSQLAIDDFVWLCGFVKWLRGPGNMRTASLMIAADAVKARLDAGLSQEWHTDDHTNVTHHFSNRRIIDTVCQRPDEPGELLAYWTANYGRAIPKPVKRGLADAVRRLYSERSLLKYDTASKGYRFGDILNLCHPRPKEMVGVPQWQYRAEGYEECPTPLKRRHATAADVPTIHHRSQAPLRAYACKCGWYHATSNLNACGPQIVIDELERRVDRLFVGGETPQGDLFTHALDRRHHPGSARIPESLHKLRWNQVLRADQDPQAWLNATSLASAGMTWEDALSAVGSKVDKAKLWEALIPSMGIMALVKNLRNFDQAGVSDKAAQQVIDRLSDPKQIAKSKLFPFRFHTAYREAPSLRWGHALDKALTASLANVPRLGGRTLIMVDTSSSMEDAVSARSTVLRWDIATLFGVALGHRCAQADVVSFSSTAKYWGDPRGADTKVFPLLNGESLLRSIERWKTGGFFLGGGTDTAPAVQRHFAGHDRVVIITDEQVGSTGDPGAVIPRDVPMYTWNIAGYAAGHSPSGSHARFTFGGLTDKSFALIPLLESGAQGAWPWQDAATV